MTPVPGFGFGLGLGAVTTAAATLTAVLGCYVAALAYQGYRRNDSETMRILAVGVLFIAVGPSFVTLVARPLLALTDAQAILGVTLSHTAGLVALYRSFG